MILKGWRHFGLKPSDRDIESKKAIQAQLSDGRFIFAEIQFEDIPSVLEQNSVASKTVRQVLKNLRENYQKFGKVTDQDLIALSSVFDETLEKALELVEGKKVSHYHTNLNIGIYKVEGFSHKIYTILPSVNYCSCEDFINQVSNGSQFTCKHVLAAAIAEVTGTKSSIEGYIMNDREEWNNRNMGQFLPGIPFSLRQGPGISPHGFGIPSNSWMHVPPQTMPWGTPPGAQPAVVRFTAGDFNPNFVPIKRKIEASMEAPPSKILVTEEKMAAHMRDLHISDVDPPPSASHMTCKEEPMETDRLPKLVISDEIKNLKTESIIPESILKKLEKPEMALVLWQPPATDLDSKLRELKKLSLNKGQEKEKEKEKEVETKDEGDMDVDIETETGNNNVDNVFRPIDPVPMPPVQNQFFQPVPQFHEYSPFLHSTQMNFQNKFT